MVSHLTGVVIFCTTSNYCGHICQLFTLGHSVYLCLTRCQLAGVWIVCTAISCIVVYYGQRTFTQCKY